LFGCCSSIKSSMITQQLGSGNGCSWVGANGRVWYLPRRNLWTRVKLGHMHECAAGLCWESVTLGEDKSYCDDLSLNFYDLENHTYWIWYLIWLSSTTDSNKSIYRKNPTRICKSHIFEVHIIWRLLLSLSRVYVIKCILLHTQ
jgi:hypothetical protein